MNTTAFDVRTRPRALRRTSPGRGHDRRPAQGRAWEATVELAPDTVTVWLRGEVDLECAHVLRDIRHLIQQAPVPAHVTVDLSGTDFMDCTGVAFLTGLRCDLGAGGRLCVTGAQPTLRHLLELTGLADLLTDAVVRQR